MEIKFEANGVEVSLFYDFETNLVDVTATLLSDPHRDDFICVVKMDKDGQYPLEPPCHYFKDGDYTESYEVAVLDRFSIELYLIKGTVNRGVDVVENGLRLN